MIVTKLENGHFKYKPETWVEYFKTNVEEGTKAVPFFLPVRRHWETRQVEAWIFPLALPVAIFYIFVFTFKSIWFDVREILALVQEWYKLKKFKKIPNEEN